MLIVPLFYILLNKYIPVFKCVSLILIHEDGGLWLEKLGKFVSVRWSFVIADNLAAHELMGFQGSFRNGLPCRSCKTLRVFMQDHKFSGTVPRTKAECDKASWTWLLLDTQENRVTA